MYFTLFTPLEMTSTMMSHFAATVEEQEAFFCSQSFSSILLLQCHCSVPMEREPLLGVMSSEQSIDHARERKGSLNLVPT